MAKSVKKTKSEHNNAEKQYKLLIPAKYQTLVALAVVLLVFMVYYSPMYFENQTFSSGDIITAQSARTYIDNEHDDFTLWYPYIFCGMPGYALTVGYKWFNLMYVGFTTVKVAFASLFSVDYAVWSFYLLILAITSYFLILYLTDNKLIALFGGLSTAFSTGIVLFLMIGHVTKLTALCFFPLLLLMVLKFEKKIKLLDVAILTVAMQLAFQGWHVQIIFYMLLSFLVYYIFNVVYALVKKENNAAMQFIKSGFVFLGAFIVALLIQSDNLTQIYEYNEYSTRGTKSITETDAGESAKSESDFYNYATNWSFPLEDMGTFIVPSFMGFGKSVYNGPLNNYQPVMINTYFGKIPLTENPMYMGVIVLFLALFGIFANYKKRFVQYLALLSVFSLLLAFGKYFSPVFDLMFYNFPFFDKFRAPIMALIIIQLSLPILAAFGLKSIIDAVKTKDESLKRIILYTAGAFTLLLVVSFVANSGLKDWFASRVNEFAAANPRMSQQFRALSDYMGDMFVGDMQFAFGICAVVFWLAYAFVIKKVPQIVFLVVVVVLSFSDLARVNKRFEEYHTDQKAESLFVEPGYIKAIKKIGDDQPFRILNLKQDGTLGSFNQNSNFNSHFLIQDLYGYSAVKPRSYQDYMDVVGPTNQTMWRMLNVKYIILEQQINMPTLRLLFNEGKTFLYEFTNALPRAYFVDSLAAAKPIDILNAVKNNSFDPKQKAFVYDNPAKIDVPDSGASVTVTKYLDEKIDLDATATGNNLLFLGDTYYPNGWHAYIDGNETDILRLNHGFRGIIVPKGEHKIEFIYKPTSFVVSKYLALGLSSLILIGLIFGLYMEKKKKTGEEVLEI